MTENNFAKSRKEGGIMFRKVLMLTSIVLVFSACEVKAGVIHSTWVGGEFGWWEQVSNWDPAKVPHNSAAETFIVKIDSNSIGVDEAKVKLQEDHPIDMLLCYGNVSLGGPTYVWSQLRLEEPNGIVNYGGLNIIAYGSVRLFEIKGNTTNIVGAVLDLWGASIFGDLYNQAGAMVEVNGEVELDGDVDNAGIIMVAPYHELETDQYFHNSGQIILIEGGCGGEVLDNNSTGIIEGFGYIYGAQEVQNKGRIIASGGSLAVLSKGPLSNSGLLSNYPLSSLQIKTAEDVNNSGTIKANTGGGVAFDYNLVNEPNGIIKLLGGTLAATTITQSAEANFTGFGGITGDLFIDPNGIIELTGPTNIVGDVNIPANATLQISDGTTLITGHATCNNGTIHMIGGRVICQGGLTNNNCNIIWEPGTYTNMADFNLDGKVNFKDFAYFGDTWLWKADWY